MSWARGRSSGWAAFDFKQRQGHGLEVEFENDSYPPLPNTASLGPSDGLVTNSGPLGKSFSSLLQPPMNFIACRDKSDCKSQIQTENSGRKLGIKIVEERNSPVDKLKKLHGWANDSLIDDILEAVNNDVDQASDLLKAMSFSDYSEDSKVTKVADLSITSELKTASLKPNEEEDLPLENSLIPWHRGFTRKARTPRQANKQTNRPSPPSNKTEESMQNPVPLVPEMGSDEASPDENDEEHLLYRVPVFDPFVSKLCTSAMSNEAATDKTTAAFVRKESEASSLMDYGNDGTGVVDDVPDDFLLSSDMDLEQFAVDFESLFGSRPGEDTFEMKECGLLSNLKDEEACEVYCFGKGRIKLEKHDELGDVATTCHVNPELEITKGTLDWNFNYDSPATGEEDEEDKKEMVVARSSAAMTMNGGAYKTEEITKKMLLSLDYGGVITAWASKGSPWITGKRPEFNQDDSWPGFMGNCSQRDANHPTYFDVWGSARVGGKGMDADGDREAKVSRYREKRRTRLFSKKIRYEVRKLNAEKRPRMKGRFVKRACFAAGLPTFSF